MAIGKVLVSFAFLALARAVTFNDLYPFDPKFDSRLEKGDSISSSKIPLAIPAFFYDKEYDYLWVCYANLFSCNILAYLPRKHTFF